MKWFWDQYTCYQAEREEITASPLRASLEQLSGLPRAMILNGEADVLRDEGEAYARKLREAGVDVTAIRYSRLCYATRTRPDECNSCCHGFSNRLAEPLEFSTE